MKAELTAEALKVTPPAVVAAITLNDVLTVATLIYIGLQAAYLLWKWWREYRASK